MSLYNPEVLKLLITFLILILIDISNTCIKKPVIPKVYTETHVREGHDSFRDNCSEKSKTFSAVIAIATNFKNDGEPSIKSRVE